MYELINTNKKQQSFTQQKSKHILNLGDYVTKKMKQLTSIAWKRCANPKVLSVKLETGYLYNDLLWLSE